MMEDEADVATYEELAQLERESQEVDEQIIAHTYLLSAPLYAKRTKTVSKIPHFWPLVFEQCPEEIDQYIQPSDSEILALHLVDFSVSRPDIPLPSQPPLTGSNGTNGSQPSSSKPVRHGSPRTLTFTFTFSPNPWFHDTTLTKTFTYLRTLTGTGHYTSAPVRIHWKCEDKDYLKNPNIGSADRKKDLTSGAGRMACELQEAIDALAAYWASELSTHGSLVGGTELQRVRSRARDLQKRIQYLKEYKALQAKVDSSSERSQSFFAWFGYRGRYVGAEEARFAEERFAPGSEVEVDDGEEAEALTEEDLLIEEEDEDAEIFPAGEELATVLAEDLWVNALRYFTQAQADDAVDSEGFSSESAWSDDEDDVPDIRSLVKDSHENGAGPPAKRRKI